MKKTFFAKAIVTVLMLALVLSGSIPVTSISVGANVSVAAEQSAVKSALEITREMGVGWNLGNALDAHGGGNSSDITSYERAWGNPTITKELIQTVHSLGFNTIRIPVTWYPHVTRQGSGSSATYVIDNAWMNHVEEIVRYAYDDGMYVILNIHHEEGYINRADLASEYDKAYSEMSPYVKSLWNQIATRFKDYDQHLIFEGMNEPRAKDGYEEWWTRDTNRFDVINKLNADFVNTVRGIDSPYKNTRILMIPSYAASADDLMMKSVTIPNTGIDNNRDGKDDYVAVSIHAYKPYDFAMGEGPHDDFNSNFDESLKSTINDIADTYVRKGIPVIIGEFSASNYGSDYKSARLAWAVKYMTYAKRAGIPCVLWDNNVKVSSDGEAHGYINRSTLNWYDESKETALTLLGTYNNPGIIWRGYIDGIADTSSGTGEGGTGGGTGGGSGTGGSGTGGTVSGSHVALTNDRRIAHIVDNETPPGYFVYRDGTSAFVAGTEIAIKYVDSSAPSLELFDKGWLNYTKISPEEVDYTNKIAFFSYDYVMAKWGKSPSLLEHIKATPCNVGNVSYLLPIVTESDDPVEEERLIVTKLSISIEANVGLNLYMELPKSATKIKIQGCKGEVNKDLSDSDKSSEYKVTYYVPAKDIGKAITVTVYSSDGQIINFENSAKVENGSYKISISDALLKMSELDSSSVELKNLAKAMYNYGAVAAKYFGSDTSWVQNETSGNVYNLVNMSDSANQSSNAGQTIRSDLAGYVSEEWGQLPNGINYLGSSLVLEDTVSIRHYFAGNISAYNVSVTGYDYTVSTVSASAGIYCVEIKNIPAAKMGEAILLQVNWSYGLKYSVMSYCKDAMEIEQDAEIKYVAVAMYDYMKAAEAYLKAKQ